MPIRRRLRKPVLKGIPLPEFQGYVKRFGHTYAEFQDAAMLAMVGRAPDYKRRKGESPTIHFYTLTGVIDWREERIADDLAVEFLDTVLIGWPDPPEAAQLRSFCFTSADV